MNRIEKFGLFLLIMCGPAWANLILSGAPDSPKTFILQTLLFIGFGLFFAGGKGGKNE